ncbi:DUF4129 domain-containing protein [Phycicoccus sp. BSK3Z-2]|uniref:DUF4129 domain-containing protein n=1 Tax=Phycicoccus avicenniae TaxID=2828860 RepID=A0A941DAQ7_9MICO|nr:DUF4129 domain-containing protein [Phycicoccus avicenniae]MBR7743537.1 DUF4129 domain-containing protein [Phycicoccus avicenniae]
MTPFLHTVVADAPLDPTSDEARAWLERELSSGVYTPRPGLLERIREWLDELFSATGGGSLPAFVLPVVLVLAVAVAVLVLLAVLRRDVGRASGASGGGVLDVPDVPADTLRDRAVAALRAGDWDTAVLDGLRAVARRAVERVVLDDAPGRTAHEVAQDLARRFPDEATALAAAADAFDAVRYGDVRATRERAEHVVALEDRLASARPVTAAEEARR